MTVGEEGMSEQSSVNLPRIREEVIATITVRHIGRLTADWFTSDGKFDHCDGIFEINDIIVKALMFARLGGATIFRFVPVPKFVEMCDTAGYPLPSEGMRTYSGHEYFAE